MVTDNNGKAGSVSESEDNMKSVHYRSRSGFTLVEMLIVVGVLGMLIGLLAPAILQSIKVAQRRARANECAMLEEAILEFWHDQNKWPIKKGDTPRKSAGYKLTYGDNNYEVFNQLVDADFGGRKKIKTYIVTGRHITTPQKETSYPSFAAASLKDVLEGRNGLSRRADPVLVYWVEFLECPKCGEYNGTDADTKRCRKCDYLFTRDDKKRTNRGLFPYKVTIDLLNNSVVVDEQF